MAGSNNWDRFGYGIDVGRKDITIEDNYVADGDSLIGYTAYKTPKREHSHPEQHSRKV